MLGHDIAAALPELREEAESLMTDAVLIQRSTGKRTDPATGKLVETWETTYDGKARWLPSVGQTTVEQAGTSVTVDTRELRIPVSADGVRAGMRVTTTASAHAPSLVGRVAVVVLDSTQSQPVHRRLQCKEA